jgi:hypothetical protein
MRPDGEITPSTIMPNGREPLDRAENEKIRGTTTYALSPAISFPLDDSLLSMLVVMQ